MFMCACAALCAGIPQLLKKAAVYVPPVLATEYEGDAWGILQHRWSCSEIPARAGARGKRGRHEDEE